MRKYSYDLNFFSQPNLLNCYWAGFIAADGNIRDKLHHVCIGLARKDKEHLERLAKDCSYNGQIRDRIIRKNDPKYLKTKYETSHIVFCGAQEWIKDLQKLNIGSKKSLTLIPPELDGDLSLAFIKGLIDGDGTIILSKNKRVEFSIVGTKEILEWITDTFNILIPTTSKHLAKPRHRSDRTQNNCWTYKLTGFRAYAILKKLKEVNTPELNRKWNKLNEACQPIYKDKYES